MVRVVSRLKKESEEIGIPIWKMPDIMLVIMAVANGFMMVATYVWASAIVSDPREAVLFVAAEAVLIVVLGNVLVESSKKMIKMSRLRKEFVHIISHQMRSPLTTIKWNVEILKKKIGDVTEEQLDCLNKIDIENEKLKAMIADILNVSRVEDHREANSLDKIDLVEVVSGCIQRLENYAKIKKMNIVFSQEKKRVIVLAEMDKISIVVANLIENAIRYSPKNSEIKIEIARKGKKAILTIKDQGVGIDSEDQKYIFNKFYRSNQAKKIEPQGTGLGLYVSKLIVEQMKGEIGFTSALDKGTVFEVKLNKA